MEDLKQLLREYYHLLPYRAEDVTYINDVNGEIYYREDFAAKRDILEAKVARILGEKEPFVEGNMYEKDPYKES